MDIDIREKGKGYWVLEWNVAAAKGRLVILVQEVIIQNDNFLFCQLV